MMYENKFILSIVSKGKIVKEQGEIVKLKFGEEFGVRVKNKNDRRALAKISIDGENVSGGGLILNSNGGVIELLRSVNKDAAFKFMPLNSNEAYVAGKSDNSDGDKGVVEVWFSLEKPYQAPLLPVIVEKHHYPYPYSPYNPWYQPSPHFLSTNAYSLNPGGRGSCAHTVSKTADCCVGFTGTNTAVPSVNLQEGCMVPGQATGQNFYYSSFIAEDTTAAYLKLLIMGFHGNEAVVSVTPTITGFCTNCGKQKIPGNYCGNCGARQ